MRAEGFEPPRAFAHRLLRPACLPFHHARATAPVLAERLRSGSHARVPKSVKGAVSKAAARKSLWVRVPPGIAMAPEPPRIVHLDQLESIPGPGTLTWAAPADARRPRVRLQCLHGRRGGSGCRRAAQRGPDARPSGALLRRGRAGDVHDRRRHARRAGGNVRVRRRPRLRPPCGRRGTRHDGAQLRRPTDLRALSREWAFRSAWLFRDDPARAREILTEGLAALPSTYWNQ